MSGDHNMYATSISQTTISPARLMHDKSQEFRWLQKDDGSRVLQVACPVQEGFNSWIEWRNIPIVKESE